MIINNRNSNSFIDFSKKFEEVVVDFTNEDGINSSEFYRLDISDEKIGEIEKSANLILEMIEKLKNSGLVDL